MCYHTHPEGAHNWSEAHSNGYSSGKWFNGHALPSHDTIFHSKEGDNASVACADYSCHVDLCRHMGLGTHCDARSAVVFDIYTV